MIVLGSVDGLQATAWSALLFAGTALVLALVVAVVLGVLDELLLRRLIHMQAIHQWLARLQPRTGERSITSRKVVQQRIWELQHALFQLEPLGPVTDPRDNDEATRDVFWALVTPAAGLPPRHLLGLLSASVQAEVGNQQPSPFVCWLAALGSMPIQPSPFAALQAQAPASNDRDNTAARAVLQTYCERALDSLQVHVLRMRTMGRHLSAMILVTTLVALLAASGRAQGAPTLHYPELIVSTLLYVTLCAVATAFVAMLSGPLERLTAARNG